VTDPDLLQRLGLAPRPATGDVGPAGLERRAPGIRTSYWYSGEIVGTGPPGLAEGVKPSRGPWFGFGRFGPFWPPFAALARPLGAKNAVAAAARLPAIIVRRLMRPASTSAKGRFPEWLLIWSSTVMISLSVRLGRAAR
jgi:hypothetical protein